jgi:hypothetical protein
MLSAPWQACSLGVATAPDSHWSPYYRVVCWLNRDSQALSAAIPTDNEILSASLLSIPCNGEAIFQHLEHLVCCNTTSGFTTAPEFLLVQFINEEISDGNA